jgi:hypothetical protein
MRFPSLVTLGQHGREVIVRFPWTMTAGVLAAGAAIVATTESGNTTQWVRVAMVSALGLPLTIALTLLAEERGWSARRNAALNLAGAALLALFYLFWPGPDRKHEAIRYFQLSAGLHLLVATLPFLGYPESNAFWQYNRRLFQAILRAVLFSLVLFVGFAIALGALDKLFGVDVPGELYGRLFLIIALVINTAIFLADVPHALRELSSDTSYPRVLQVFARYILTPIVFVYLILLLAYLVKIIAGGEWPSGWIGWLVTSVAVAGLLGFLLVHPLRDHPSEGWIRAYTRWLFIGLIPAAVMLLVAFWKRVLPYGLTELRLLGLLLGLWLLALAVSYTLRPHAGIRRIPVTLAALFLLTAYGPLSLTSLSVSSQGRRLRQLVGDSRPGQQNAREASAALRFLLEHGARTQIAAALHRELPSLAWDSLPDQRDRRDSAASRILKLADIPYVPEYAYSPQGYLYLSAQRQTATPLTGYDWMLEVSSANVAPLVAGVDTVWIRFDSATSVVRVRVQHDTLLFDLRRIAGIILENPTLPRHNLPAEQLRFEAATSGRRARLALESLHGKMLGDSIDVRGWQGKLFLGRAH